MVTNNGFLPETYHIVFTAEGNWIGQSGVITLDPGNIHGTTVNFTGSVSGNANICADLVCDTATANTLTVASPTNGEIWQRGTTQTITWGYTGTIGSLISIYLYKSGVYTGTIATGVPIGTGGVGFYTWDISSQTGLITGNDFTIVIYNESNNAISDTSDYFALTPAGIPEVPVASFTISGGIFQRVPAAVQFTDTSTGTPTSWLWNFGDGTTSTLQNPIHTYSTAIDWCVVTLTVTNALGSNTRTWIDALCIIPSTSPIPSFIVSPVSGSNPLTVTITDTSEAAPGTTMKYQWYLEGIGTAWGTVSTITSKKLYLHLYYCRYT